MKVILNQTINDLGAEGEILIVKDGYARNYLIPKGWAKEATKVNIIAIEKDLDNNILYMSRNDIPNYYKTCAHMMYKMCCIVPFKKNLLLLSTVLLTKCF